MKCSFSECENKATTGMGWGGNDKGTIPLCDDCLKTNFEHEKARKSLLFMEVEAEINKIFKRIKVTHGVQER